MKNKKLFYIFGILVFLFIIEVFSLILLQVSKRFNTVYFKFNNLEKIFIDNYKNDLIPFYFSKIILKNLVGIIIQKAIV